MKTPKSRSRKKGPTLPGMAEENRPTVRWFARDGCVVREGEQRSVVIGGRKVGSWEPGERGIRNALMVELAKDSRIILEDLAKAFEVSSETLRLQRRLYEEEGLEAVLKRGEYHQEGGRQLKPAVRRKMERLFAQGKGSSEIVAALKGKVHRTSVAKYRRGWEARQKGRAEPCQQALPLKAEPAMLAPESPVAIGTESESRSEEKGAAAAETTLSEEKLGPIRVSRPPTSERMGRIHAKAAPAAPEAEGRFEEIGEYAPFSAKGVQQVGAWLLLVTIAGLGLYRHLRHHERGSARARPVRVAIDAVLTALAVGGRCVESIRRLATSSIAALMLVDTAPSASWVRRTLGGYCAGNDTEALHKEIAGELLLRAKASTPARKPVVLFFDNHARPYTGKHSLRRIWRMQGKCTVPGAMDYWVHDLEGRPVLQIPVAPNASLPQILPQWVGFLRSKLGQDTPLLFVFDRAGAFPGLFKWLRDHDVEFVTYQRARYRKFRHQWFVRHGRAVTLREASGEKIRAMVQESGMNQSG